MNFMEKNFKQQIRKLAYQAGIALYGEDLVYRNSDIKVRKLSDRVKDQLENGTCPDVAGCVDDYEYAFNGDGGIEASGETLTNTAIHDGDMLYLYDPEFGIDVLKVDMTNETMFDMIRKYDEDSDM